MKKHDCKPKGRTRTKVGARLATLVVRFQLGLRVIKIAYTFLYLLVSRTEVGIRGDFLYSTGRHAHGRCLWHNPQLGLINRNINV
jgi:hypothetical protein